MKEEYQEFEINYLLYRLLGDKYPVSYIGSEEYIRVKEVLNDCCIHFSENVETKKWLFLEQYIYISKEQYSLLKVLTNVDLLLINNDLTCRKLPELPDNLIINGVLDLSNSILKRLPENLYADRIWIDRVNTINIIPKSTSVGFALCIPLNYKILVPEHLESKIMLTPTERRGDTKKYTLDQSLIYLYKTLDFEHSNPTDHIKEECTRENFRRYLPFLDRINKRLSKFSDYT